MAKYTFRTNLLSNTRKERQLSAEETFQRARKNFEKNLREEMNKLSLCSEESWEWFVEALYCFDEPMQDEEDQFTQTYWDWVTVLQKLSEIIYTRIPKTWWINNPYYKDTLDAVSTTKFILSWEFDNFDKAMLPQALANSPEFQFKERFASLK